MPAARGTSQSGPRNRFPLQDSLSSPLEIPQLYTTPVLLYLFADGMALIRAALVPARGFGTTALACGRNGDSVIALENVSILSHSAASIVDISTVST